MIFFANDVIILLSDRFFSLDSSVTSLTTLLAAWLPFFYLVRPEDGEIILEFKLHNPLNFVNHFNRTCRVRFPLMKWSQLDRRESIGAVVSEFFVNKMSSYDF